MIKDNACTFNFTYDNFLGGGGTSILSRQSSKQIYHNRLILRGFERTLYRLNDLMIDSCLFPFSCSYDLHMHPDPEFRNKLSSSTVKQSVALSSFHYIYVYIFKTAFLKWTLIHQWLVPYSSSPHPYMYILHSSRKTIYTLALK